MKTAKAAMITVLTLFFIPTTSHSQLEMDWAVTYPGWYASGVVIDSDGNSYVTGTTQPDAAHNFRTDIILAKYDREGNLVWAFEFDETDDGTNGTDASEWVTRDPSGNIIITGGSFINGTGDDFITLKFDTDGNIIWKARSTAGLEASRVETDASGNVYVMGPSSTVASARNYVTIKYDPDGNQLWERTYNGPNSFDDTPLSMAVTPDGMVAVTGTSTGGVTSFDIATVLYDTDGNEQWVRRYNGTDRADGGNDVAFGPNGEVYVAGYIFDEETFTTDAAVLKYSTNGDLEWARFYIPSDGPDSFRRVRVDSEGNVVVAGHADQPDLGIKFVTAKYDPDGNPLWIEVLDIGSNILVWNMVLGPDDAVYVAGETGQFVTTYKYDSDGVFQWSDLYDAGILPDRGRALALDPPGGIVVVGEWPFLTIRYIEEVNAPPVLSDIPDQEITMGDRFRSIRADRFVEDPDDHDSTIVWSWSGNTNIAVRWNPDRRVFRFRPMRNWTGSETITFEATDPHGLSDSEEAVFTVSALNGVPGAALQSDLPMDTRLIGNFPNPFNPVTVIRYDLAEASRVRLKVFDVLGEAVAVLADQLEEAGRFSVPWDARNSSGRRVPSGVYFYTLELENVSDGIRTVHSRKMLLLK